MSSVILDMKFRIPRGTRELSWTKHSIEKMKFYGLSESRVKRVWRNPKRVEEGIAPETIAIMQLAGSKKRPHEIWVMYQKILDFSNKKSKARIISCWRYPGRSPVGKAIPIPEEIRSEIEEEIEKLKREPLKF